MRHAESKAEGTNERSQSQNGDIRESPRGKAGVEPLTATSDIAAAAAVAIKRARALVGVTWKKLVDDLATIP